MTVSANATLNYQRDEIIRMAYQLAGLLQAGREPPADDIAMAADFMNLELMNLQAEGVVLQTIERTTKSLTLAAGATYTLDSDTIDVQIGPNDEAGAIVAAAGGNPTPIYVMSRDEYITQLASTATGRPSRVYVEKQATVKAIFWPAPDATYTWTYAKTRLLRDMDTGAVTVDLARRWLQAVAYAVAAQVALAKGMQLERVGFLRQEAERMKYTLRSDDNQRGGMRFRVVHRGRNW